MTFDADFEHYEKLISSLPCFFSIENSLFKNIFEHIFCVNDFESFAYLELNYILSPKFHSQKSKTTQ